MTRHRGLLVLLIAIALVGLTPPARAAEPLRILIEGDSIAQGFHGDYTWRFRLDKELRRQGVAFDLVGSRRAPSPSTGFTAASYLDPGFDQDHLAQAGSTLEQHVGWVAEEVAGQDPDLVVLAAGLNDLRRGATPAQVDGRLRDWVAAARAAKPSLRIVVSPVLEAVEATRPWLGERVREYDALAAATVAELSSAGSPITMADTTRGWSVPDHTYDNMHPNPTGETLIAQRVAEHLRVLGVLPQQPSIFRATAWARPIASRVALLRDRRAVVTWDRQGVTYARVLIQRAGYAAHIGNYRGGTVTTTALAPGASYVIRVAYVRQRMSTPYGPAHRVVAPRLLRPAAVARVIVSAAGVRWTRSPLATQYVVKFRKARKKRWITRQTSALSIAAPKVKRAKVWAVNSSGRSAVRVGRR